MATLGIVDENDILATIEENDLVNALTFLRTTIEGFGPEDVGQYLGKTDDEVYALSERIKSTVEQLLS